MPQFCSPGIDRGFFMPGRGRSGSFTRGKGFMDKVKELGWKPVSILSIIAGVAASLPIHNFYVGWHDDRYAKRTEVILIAQADRLEGKINLAQATADETKAKVGEVSEQVKNLQISTAITAVAALREDLDRHERNPQTTDQWLRERDRLTRQIEQAQEYKQCLIDDRYNCDIFRPW